MVNKKIVLICSIIALIVVVTVVGIEIKKLNQEEYISSNLPIENINSNNQVIQNEAEQENTIQDEENKIVEEPTKIEKKLTDTEQKKVVQGEEETSSNKENTEDTQEKAIELVKKEWGEDSTVYYTVDNHQNNIYIISVRSKSTTETVAEYEVDTKNKQVKMK